MLLQLATLTLSYWTLSTQQLTNLVNLLHFSDISRTHRSSISKQHFVPKTKFNIGKWAFSVPVPTIWNQIPVTIKSSETPFIKPPNLFICLKLLFHHKCLAVPCSNDDFYLSPFMITPNDFVCCTSELEFVKDIDAIDVLQLLLLRLRCVLWRTVSLPDCCPCRCTCARRQATPRCWTAVTRGHVCSVAANTTNSLSNQTWTRCWDSSRNLGPLLYAVKLATRDDTYEVNSRSSTCLPPIV